MTGRAGARPGWLHYRAWRGAAGHAVEGVAGDLRVLPGVAGPGPGSERELLVHLPPGAEASGRRYPVVYLHDGRNLFDAATSFSGEWRADETLEALAAEGLPLIAVGVPSLGELRAHEYTPYPSRRALPWAVGGGDAYLDFLAGVVKPLVDASFPTRPDRASTGMLGSSFGGLISLRAAVRLPDVFGRIGAMSAAIGYGQRRILGDLARIERPPLRAYLDAGGDEGSFETAAPARRSVSRGMVRDAGLVRDALAAAGLREPDGLRLVIDPAAIHHEVAWARRLPDALRFLFGETGA